MTSIRNINFYVMNEVKSNMEFMNIKCKGLLYYFVDFKFLMVQMMRFELTRREARAPQAGVPPLKMGLYKPNEKTSRKQT